jgi:hypothetical protein
MTDFRPKETVQKILISTTSRFIDEYKTNEILITHAFPSFRLPDEVTLTENPICRNSFVVVFETPPLEKDIVYLPDYSLMGDIICAYLAVLFGKRFDNHGPLETIGMFRVPHLEPYSSVSNPSLPQNNHRPRIDLGIELDLSEFSRIAPLFNDDFGNEKFINFFNTASRFYLQALQSFETHPETAYLHLITCGEILSNYYEYDKDDLLDGKTKNILARIEEGLEDGQEIVKQVKSRLLQVKRKFVKTVTHLLNDHFFSHSESHKEITALKKDTIEQRVAASYDLRSRYVHTGIDFGHWISLDGLDNAEVQDGIPIVDDKEFQEILAEAPMYLGMERIMRYCLLRFIHLEGIRIDSRLDND